MPIGSPQLEGKQLILRTTGIICSTTRELAASEIFERLVEWYIADRLGRNAAVLDGLGVDLTDPAEVARLMALLRALAAVPMDQAVMIVPETTGYLERRKALHMVVEDMYDYWRSFDRFMICGSPPGPDSHDRRPYRTFERTVEQLTHLVRALYRDICESITGEHPRVYRQVCAGCEVGLIAVEGTWPCPDEYADLLCGMPVIRQVLIDPPLILRPPMNRRTGQFMRIEENPLEGVVLPKDEWLCFPAQVGPLMVFVCFHRRFIGLGCSLANLFELATDEQLESAPDAIYMFGVPPETLARYGELPTVFWEDERNGIMVAAVPNEDRFGYFGYIKKMVLTLHNVVMMRRGRMPYHGAQVCVRLPGDAAANILLIGDTAAGKSECLEGFRVLGERHIRSLTIVADDMGSLEIDSDGRVIGYGTEIGAFIRLDDLQHGYAFGQVDRAIIHNPQLVNARVILPVTTIDEVLRGYPLDVLLYANNYEEVDEAHPLIERFETVEEALHVFREGAAMAKGTTTSTGLVHSYFANIFGPPQHMDLHEELARKTFEAAFKSGVYVGQIRTRLGITGYETEGPEEAARALLRLVEELSSQRQAVE